MAMALEFRPNAAKIVELLLYLAHKRPGTDKYQAVKFFYLADREHLNRYGRPITSERYFALKYGPVASTVKDLMERNEITMRKVGLKSLPFDLVDVQARGPENKPFTTIANPHREFDAEAFSRSDLRVFDEILEKHGHLDFDALYNLTHSHTAYKKAWAARGGSARSPMAYEDMIESDQKRESILADIGPIASRL
jgi:uncharacterized phage-associated protein